MTALVTRTTRQALCGTISRRDEFSRLSSWCRDRAIRTGSRFTTESSSVAMRASTQAGQITTVPRRAGFSRLTSYERQARLRPPTPPVLHLDVPVGNFSVLSIHQRVEASKTQMAERLSERRAEVAATSAKPLQK